MTEILGFLTQHFIIVGTFILAIILLSQVFRRQERSNTSIAWLLVIVLIPYLGVPAYILFGDRKLRRQARRKKHIYDPPGVPSSDPAPARPRLKRLLAAYGLPGARPGNRIELVDNNENVYSELMRLIDESTHSVHLMTFIFSSDDVGRHVAQALIKKANQGVKVRLLVDGLGSFYARFSLLRKLQKSGVEVGVFMRMLPIHRRWSANLRNHRKIAVFDGHTALIGGMNIGSEYMGPNPDEFRWIDTMTLVSGPAVEDLNQIFVHDWLFATRRLVEPVLRDVPEKPENFNAQIIASGPDINGDPLYDVLIASIHNAEERIWIATPYFVPDYELVRALTLAARAGVDVRLLTPLCSNHPVADMARNRILRKMLSPDFDVYFETTQMVHAKHILIDQNFALAGSANIDMRSLYFNYEVGLLSDSPEVAEMTEKWMSDLMDNCEKNNLPKQSFLRRWAEDLCWLMTPIL